MRILVVVSYLYPALTYGGPAKVVYDLAEELSRANQIIIYTTDVWDEKRRIRMDEKLRSRNNFRVIYFQNWFNRVAYKYRFFTAFGMVFSFLRHRKEFDIVHIHDVFIFPQLLIGCLCGLYKIPYVISPHGVLDPLRVKRKSILKRIIYNLLAKNVIFGAKFIIATSEEEKKVLNNLGLKSVRTVYNGISLNLTKKTNKFSKYKKSGKFTLLYIGKIHPLKGLSYIIKSLPKLNFSHQFLIAGPDDGGKSELISLISKHKLKNVSFLGYVDEFQKSELFSVCDVFVHPSLSEGFSMSILEALKYAKPVLITKACNFDDIEKYNAGVVLDENKLISQVPQALNSLSKNRNSLKQMGKNGRILLEQQYSISSMAKNILKIYEICN